MRTMVNKDVQLLEQIVSLKQPVLLKTMTTLLEKHYNRVVMTRDYVFAEGDIPVALVAHLDTVFKRPPEEVYYDRQKGVIWSPDGLGADDRAGVFAIVKILERGLRPHIIFTTDEEVGGIGASNLVRMESTCPFKELKYIIELDRQGTNDCVFYDCDNRDFVRYVERFGFIESWGSYSDIVELCPAWGVAGVNLSIGYRNEHSVSETLHVNPLLSTIAKVCNMLKDAKNAQKFDWVPSKYYYSYLSKMGLAAAGAAYGMNFEDEWWMEGLQDPVICEVCGKTYDEYETFPVKARDGSTVYYCGDCIIDRVEWCEECNEAFEIDPTHPSERLCNDCKVKLKNKYKKKTEKKGD